MERDTKIILKNIAIFGLIFTVMNIILSLILQELHAGKNQDGLLLFIGIEGWLWNLIHIGVLVWALIIVSKKLEELHYWKLGVTAIGIVVLDYHLFYLYDVIDYYLIHEPPKAGSNALENLLTLFERNPKPRYSPYYDFVGSLIDIIRFSFRMGKYSDVLFQLIFGMITLPVWVSGVVFILVRNKARNKKVGSESPLIDQ